MKLLKIFAGLVAGIVLILALVLGAAYVLSNRAMNADWDVTPVAVQLSTDSATLARGHHVAEIRGCLDCHNTDLAGRVFVDALPAMGLFAGSNLTSGRGGIAASYSDADWVRAIRDGVGPDGKTLVFMPSYEFRPLGPEDLGALISYVKSVEPVDKDKVEPVLGPISRVLYMLGQFPLMAAEMVDHSDTAFDQPETGATVEYGAYLSAACIGCHGPGLSGGTIPGGDPSWPAAGNLTPHESGISSWTLEGFHSFAQTGVTPDGRSLDPAVMPWVLLGAFTPEEREALWLYLRTLPATAKGNR